MSILLMFSVLAVAGWLVLSLVTRTTDDPGDTVAEYSRALNALAPDASTHRSPGRTGAARHGASRQRSARRPARTATRPRSSSGAAASTRRLARR